MKIPKTLHYVWFGNEKPKDVEKNIRSWKRNLGSDWKIKEWNKDNFDVDSHPFTKYHYKHKNWAFLSDYIRGYALFSEGGFYFDTDVELVGSLDKFLEYDLVLSKNWKISLTASTMGSISESKIMMNYLNSYNSFIVKVTQPFVMSSQILTSVAYKELNFSLTKETQIIGNTILLNEKILQVSSSRNESVSIHHHYDDWKGKKKNYTDTKFYNRKLENSKEEVSQKNINNFQKEIKKKNKYISKYWI